MCLESYLWDSNLCVPIWKSAVTPSNRLLFRLALWEPGIGANESGLLPTLTTTGNSNAKGSSEKAADGVATAIRRMLPTLTAQDAEQAKFFARGNPMLGTAVRSLMPTLLAADSKGGVYKKPQGGPSLRTFLPTLCNRDFKAPHSAEHVKTQRSRGHGCSILPDLFNGPLNPRWCEWFMGYPIGHTELKDLATRLSLKSRSRSSAGSGKSKRK